MAESSDSGLDVPSEEHILAWAGGVAWAGLCCLLGLLKRCSWRPVLVYFYMFILPMDLVQRPLSGLNAESFLLEQANSEMRKAVSRSGDAQF